MAVVLKQRHSLVGKNLVPLIMEVKNVECFPSCLNRLKKEHPLENYSKDELLQEFKKLTGGDALDILKLISRADSLDDIRILMHCAIDFANTVGAPKGTTLLEPKDKDPASTSSARPEVDDAPLQPPPKERNDMEGRVKCMEDQLEAFKKRQTTDKVEEALKQGEGTLPKKQKLCPDVPVWETNASFDPLHVQDVHYNEWVNYRGEPLQLPFCYPSAEEVARGATFEMLNLPFHNPDSFRAGNIHENIDAWRLICENKEVLDWLEEGVRVDKYLKHFKGNFKGKHYDSDVPPPAYFCNAPNCEEFVDFISKTLLDRVRQGSMSVWGKVGECEPPYLVMPLTVEPSKPRLCHDERFLNLWIVDKPFSLDTLKDVPRLISKGTFISTVDDKSGYDHIRLHDSSRKYFGVQFGGYYLVYNVIPFGFKTSAYIYHTTGLVATSYCRRFGGPCLQYIDDRLIAEFKSREIPSEDVAGYSLATRSLYIMCQILIRLGYFIGLQKSLFSPSQFVKFLGFYICSLRLAFIIPDDKKQSFAKLKDHILESDFVDVKTLQRFAGKCISFMLACPAVKLYSREINLSIGKAVKNSRMIRMEGELRIEIQHWKFIDNWTGCVPWRVEKHLQIAIYTDASLFKWVP